MPFQQSLVQGSDQGDCPSSRALPAGPSGRSRPWSDAASSLPSALGAAHGHTRRLVSSLCKIALSPPWSLVPTQPPTHFQGPILMAGCWGSSPPCRVGGVPGGQEGTHSAQTLGSLTSEDSRRPQQRLCEWPGPTTGASREHACQDTLRLMVMLLSRGVRAHCLRGHQGLFQ